MLTRGTRLSNFVCGIVSVSNLVSPAKVLTRLVAMEILSSLISLKGPTVYTYLSAGMDVATTWTEVSTGRELHCVLMSLSWALLCFTLNLSMLTCHLCTPCLCPFQIPGRVTRERPFQAGLISRLLLIEHGIEIYCQPIQFQF